MDRTPKLNDLLHNILAEILSTKIDIPLEYFVTVSKVECASNLKTARAYISVFPFSKSEEALRFLIRNKRDIQLFLGRKWNFKFTPVLNFIIDKTTERTSEITDIMDQL